jgi:hypothetical protein
MKIRMRAATFFTKSENPEKSFKLDRNRYEKCHSNDSHQIWWHMAQNQHHLPLIFEILVRVVCTQISNLKPLKNRESNYPDLLPVWMYSLLNYRVTISVSQTHCSLDSFPRSILAADSFFGWNFSTDSFSAKVRIISRGHLTNNLSIVQLKHTNDSKSPVPSSFLRNHRQSDNSEF